MENKLRTTSTKAIYQRENLRVVCQNSYDNNGNSCKSAVAVGNYKIIKRYWEATCQIQKNNVKTKYPRPQIENKLRSTELKEFNYQRKNLGVAFQPSCDKIGNPCKSAVAVEHAKIIYKD